MFGAPGVFVSAGLFGQRAAGISIPLMAGNSYK
jgi:hypothetical protein